MAKTVCFINEKGGVGKTSVCYNTAWELTSKGKKILMIDLDGQRANLSFFSGVTGEKTIIDVLRDGVPITDVVVPVRHGLDIVPAGPEVARIGMECRVSKLKRSLSSIDSLYDLIFIDVTPSPGWAHYLSLSVSDYATVIMLPDVASLEGNTGILDSIEDVTGVTNPNLRVAGILFNRYDSRTGLGRQVTAVAERMAEDMGTKIFNTRIPQAISLSECVATHIGVTEYDPTGRGAETIRSFADELMEAIN